MFCGLQKMINCSVISSFGDTLILRRFGLDSSGTALTYDDFGEPITLNTGINYYDRTFKGIVETKTEENDEQSKTGGRSDQLEKLTILVKTDEDILENDVIIYPTSTNDTYRVKKVYTSFNEKLKTIECILEIRNYK